MLVSLSTMAQGEMDAYRFSKSGISGTSRSAAMAGSFGALGGDLSTMGTNPAGMAVYSRTDANITINFLTTDTKGSYESNPKLMTNDRYETTLGNASVVFSNDGRGSLVRWNLGFGYNELYSYSRAYGAASIDSHASLSNYMANLAYGIDESKFGRNSDDMNWATVPWLANMGYWGYAIDPVSSVGGKQAWVSSFDGLFDQITEFKETGSANEYTFNASFNIEDRLYLGTTFSLTNIAYSSWTSYDENIGGDSDFGLGLENMLTSSGNGYNFKFGAIYRPIPEIRLGVAYHTPTYYRYVTDTYYANFYGYGIEVPDGVKSKVIDTEVFSPEISTTYRYRTPDKWIFSLATTIARFAMVNVDYELVDYDNMTLKYGLDENVSEYIKDDFGAMHTVRLGLEARPLKWLSLRGGVMAQSSPFEFDLDKGTLAVSVKDYNPSFMVDKGSMHYTFGLGFRLGRLLYTDLACVLSNYYEDLYSFPNFKKPNGDWVENEKGTVRTDRTKIMWTIGCVF